MSATVQKLICVKGAKALLTVDQFEEVEEINGHSQIVNKFICHYNLTPQIVNITSKGEAIKDELGNICNFTSPMQALTQGTKVVKKLMGT